VYRSSQLTLTRRVVGFTGTPIFTGNAGTSSNPQLHTTEQAFGDKLHTYTIVDAISDKNVVPFGVGRTRFRLHGLRRVLECRLSTCEVVTVASLGRHEGRR